MLDTVRLTTKDYDELSDDVRNRINRNRFKTESEWLRCGFNVPQNRTLTVTLTPENIEYFENLPFDETIAYLEKLDDDYYKAVPPVEELARQYGNSEGDRFFSERDLYLHYQYRYLSEHHIDVYDINDERQCFSRRY